MSDVELPELDTATSAPQTEQLDWEKLRTLSLRPGGFREDRATLWAQLLNVDPSPPAQTESPPPPDSQNVSPSSTSVAVPAECDAHLLDLGKQVEPHPDERQVRLDTDRSFVLYPVADMEERERRQSELHDLIVAVFRKRRRLSYFQGYHDIVSVLFLTLPKELQLLCVEKLSLHRVRDSMGASLEPVVGLLRVLTRVLSLADPEYASRLESHTPLPYYSLSNLLTLFSHDMPTLPLIQHVFDYLLSRPPIAVVYLAVAVVLTRKQEVEKLEEEGEDGMIHSLLSSMPDLYDEDEHDIDTGPEQKAIDEEGEPPNKTTDAEDEPQNSECQSLVPPPATPQDQSIDSSLRIEEDTSPEVSADASSQEQALTAIVTDEADEDNSSTNPQQHADGLEIPDDPVPTPDAPDESHDTEEDTSNTSPQLPSHRLEASGDTAQTFDTALEDMEESTVARSGTLRRSSSASVHVRRPRVSLSSLLQRSDELYSQYPPTHPSVALSTIMGPQSVVFTWSERPSELPSDDEAELMVTQPHLVVLPMPEEMDSKEATDDEKETPRGKRRHRRLHKPRRLSTMVERKTVVASAVLVLGVAMAIYGLQATPERHHSHASLELRRLSRFMGGVVVGVGERLWDGFMAMNG